jgi:hypothetical protein
MRTGGYPGDNAAGLDILRDDRAGSPDLDLGCDARIECLKSDPTRTYDDHRVIVPQ